MSTLSRAQIYVENIRKSGLSIYDRIEIGHPSLWIPSPELEAILNHQVSGLDVSGLPLRTRSKVIKEAVCRAIGYPVPSSFQKTQPRFPGQFFDTYTQKSNNLQVWNEELSPSRRYVVLEVTPDDHIGVVRVVTGDTLSILDTTGTLTQKYQARLDIGENKAELISQSDTELLADIVSSHTRDDLATRAPIDAPEQHNLLSITEIFSRLLPVIGMEFQDRGALQDRNRGADLHRHISAALGYSHHLDNGRFPDIRHQLLEVKLQTSPTIDLGLVCPDSTEPLDVPMISGRQIRHCDVRYGIFYGQVAEGKIKLTNFYLTTGQHFFNRFRQFQGKVLNRKIQIHLPHDFFR